MTHKTRIALAGELRGHAYTLKAERGAPQKLHLADIAAERLLQAAAELEKPCTNDADVIRGVGLVLIARRKVTEIDVAGRKWCVDAYHYRDHDEGIDVLANRYDVPET